MELSASTSAVSWGVNSVLHADFPVSPDEEYIKIETEVFRKIHYSRFNLVLLPKCDFYFTCRERLESDLKESDDGEIKVQKNASTIGHGATKKDIYSIDNNTALKRSFDVIDHSHEESDTRKIKARTGLKQFDEYEPQSIRQEYHVSEIHNDNQRDDLGVPHDRNLVLHESRPRGNILSEPEGYHMMQESSRMSSESDVQECGDEISPMKDRLMNDSLHDPCVSDFLLGKSAANDTGNNNRAIIEVTSFDSFFPSLLQDGKAEVMRDVLNVEVDDEEW